jgi:hypothetical protein
MKWIRDKTGRFPERPFYDRDEIDFECERIVGDFMRAKHDKVEFPISTDDATILVERDTSDLDLYADLSQEGEEVEGVTDFFLSKKPSVRVVEHLSTEPHMQNRLRTTLMHEYGHVKFHDFLWRRFSQERLFGSPLGKGPRCKRSTILTTSQVDWLEWQAAYASGAFLMPITSIKQLAQSLLQEWGMYSPIPAESARYDEFLGGMAARFSVSGDAARVRLSQLGYLSESGQNLQLL